MNKSSPPAATSNKKYSKKANSGFETFTTQKVNLSINKEQMHRLLFALSHLIEIIYFENNGGNTLSGTISGPDTGNTTVDLASYPPLSYS